MKKRLIFATREATTSYLTNARSPYKWTECGVVVLPLEASETEVLEARKAANIPDNALCVASELIFAH